MATITCQNGCATFRGQFADLQSMRCDACGMPLVNMSGKLRPDVRALIKGIGFINFRCHAGNIAALHFDGPEFDRVMKLHGENPQPDKIGLANPHGDG